MSEVILAAIMITGVLHFHFFTLNTRLSTLLDELRKIRRLLEQLQDKEKSTTINLKK